MIDASLRLPCGLTLHNRLVKSAMSEALADTDNNPSPALIRLYETWGASGAALLITGNTAVDRTHLEHAGNVVLDDASDLEKAARLSQAAKSGGARVLAQLAHAGRQTPEGLNPRPLSISDVPMALPGYGPPIAATRDDLADIVARFARAAAIARDTGFDGVEVHAAHGYLLSAALSPRINTRHDAWGGDLQGRARLPIDVVKAVRAALGSDRILAVKLNASDFQRGGLEPADSVRTAELLALAGADFIEVSGGTFENPRAYQHRDPNGAPSREAYFLETAKQMKAAIDIPVMVTGGVRARATAMAALETAAADLLGFGRPFIVDPMFPAKLLRGDIDSAPAPERDFPPAETLPNAAVLNWFCDQLAQRGESGAPDPNTPLLTGHERYLKRLERLTTRWRAAHGG